MEQDLAVPCIQSDVVLWPGRPPSWTTAMPRTCQYPNWLLWLVMHPTIFQENSAALMACRLLNICGSGVWSVPGSCCGPAPCPSRRSRCWWDMMIHCTFQRFFRMRQDYHLRNIGVWPILAGVLAEPPLADAVLDPESPVDRGIQLPQDRGILAIDHFWLVGGVAKRFSTRLLDGINRPDRPAGRQPAPGGVHSRAGSGGPEFRFRGLRYVCFQWLL